MKINKSLQSKLIFLSVMLTSLLALLFLWNTKIDLLLIGIQSIGSLAAQLILTSLIILAWIAWGAYYWRKQSSKVVSLEPAQQAIHLLLQHTREALLFLFSQKKRPWILLFGTTNSGKTTFLANSGLKLQSTHQQSLTTFKSTKIIDWWFDETSIFIDPAGKYCAASSENPLAFAEWQHFLHLLQDQRNPPLFEATWFIVDAVFLCQATQSEWSGWLSNTMQSLQPLLQINPKITLTIFLTKMDRISGFKEFFADLTQEEYQQYFGFSLFQDQDQIPIIELFQKRFFKLLHRLNQRLIWRLHHEHNLSRRLKIIDFSLQLKKFSLPLEALIEQLTLSTKIQLSGVYFTSMLQKGPIVSYFSKHLELISPLQKDIRFATAVRYKPFFVHHVVIQGVKNAKIPFKKPLSFLRLSGLIGAITFIIAIFFVLQWGYQHNLRALHLIQSQLYALTTASEPQMQLEQLETTLVTLNQHSALYYRWVGLGEAAMLRSLLQKQYNHLLMQNFVPYLHQQLVEQIKSNLQQHPAELYQALRVYLMLANPNRIDSEIVMHWFQRYWQKQFPHDPLKINNLSIQLSQWLVLEKREWPINIPLIKTAQSALQQQPLTEIALILLQDNYRKKQPVSIFNNHSLNFLDFTSAVVPYVFSHEAFNTIYNHQIPKITEALIQDNWVLGPRVLRPKISSTQLSKEVRAEYLNQFREAWENALQKITLIQPLSQKQIITIITLLNDKSSVLWKNFEKIIQQTTPEKFKHLIKNSPYHNQLATLIDNNSYFEDMQATLKKLNNYLNDIAPSTLEAEKNAYQVAVKQFADSTANAIDPITKTLQLSRSIPFPFQNWLAVIAQESLSITLLQSQNYLNRLWSENILTYYKEYIADRYPIFEKSKVDINAVNFTQFFGPGGLLETFFNQYLKPFVDTRQAYWSWKTLADRKLAIPQATLDMIIRASMIQKMFYTNNPKTPLLRFSLTPINLTENISFFLLNIGGQRVEYYPGIKHTRTLMWPSPKGTQIIMRFNSLSANKSMLTLDGFWSWLRLVHRSELQTTSSPQEFQLTFSIDNYRAQYDLVADNPINPYLPGILTAFRCPEKL